MKIYKVGGCIRDEVLGKIPKDIDYVVTGSNPQEMLSKGFTQAKKVKAPVFLHPETQDEYALARTENKIGKGYSEFSFFTDNVSIEEDSQRRDFTINALYKDLNSNKIIDPTNGLSDIKNKIIRPISERFKEDPMRALRAARFSCEEGFQLSSIIFDYVTEMKSNGEFLALTGQNIKKEMRKAFKYEKPSKFFYTLKDLNILDQVFPHLYNLIDVPQVEKWHPEGCAFTHVMIVIDECRKLTSHLPEDISFKLLYTCLVHDLGKGITPKDILPQHIGHEESGKELVQEMSNFLNISKTVSKFALDFTQHHLRIHKALILNPKKVLKLLKQTDCLKKSNRVRLTEMLICSKSDEMGKLNSNYRQSDFLLESFDSLNSIDSRKVIGNQKNKNFIQELIHMERIKVIKKVKEKY